MGIFNWFGIYDQSSPEFLSCATKIGHNLFSDKFFSARSDISIFSATDRAKKSTQMPQRSNFRLNEHPNHPPIHTQCAATATPHSKTRAFFRIYRVSYRVNHWNWDRLKKAFPKKFSKTLFFQNVSQKCLSCTLGYFVFFFPEKHILKISIFTKFIFSSYPFFQNKIHTFIISFYIKFTVSKPSFFTKFTFFNHFWIKCWVLPQCELKKVLPISPKIY